MPNWKRIKELRDDLDRPWDPKAFRFDMSGYIYTDDPDATVGKIRDGVCATECCLAGSAALMFMPNRNAALLCEDEINWHSEGEKALGLTAGESSFMFGGLWRGGSYLSEIEQADAVRYLDKVLKEKNVMVTI